jgi:uncharacterized protein YheU (UPF0270 family)
MNPYRLNDIVRWSNNDCCGIVKFVGEEDCLVNFLGHESFIPHEELHSVPTEELNNLVKLFILQQYKSYQEVEVSARFTVEIRATAYASGRDGLPIEFVVGDYQNTVKTGGLDTSVQVWLARETANVALAPQALLA